MRSDENFLGAQRTRPPRPRPAVGLRRMRRTAGLRPERHAATRRGTPARRIRDSDFVQSLDRGLAVIRAFGPDRERLSLSEVARATGLTRAAARRFLLTLVKLGYVRSDGREFSLRPTGAGARLRLPVGTRAARDRRAASGGAVGQAARVLVDLRARRPSHRLRGQSRDQADHDGRDLGRHQVPRLRDLDGPGAAGRDERGRARTSTSPRPPSRRSPSRRSLIPTGSGRSSARSAGRATRSSTRNSRKGCGRSQRPIHGRGAP